jgi:hypothetical protein
VAILRQIYGDSVTTIRAIERFIDAHHSHSSDDRVVFRTVHQRCQQQSQQRP